MAFVLVLGAFCVVFGGRTFHSHMQHLLCVFGVGLGHMRDTTGIFYSCDACGVVDERQEKPYSHMLADGDDDDKESIRASTTESHRRRK